MTASLDTTTSHDITTDAGWRAWGAAWRAALTAAGLTRTSDTGQVDWTTSTTPAAEMTSTANMGGYEMWRFNDTEQATNPIYIRVNYGRGDSAGQTRIVFQVGVGSNGSGTLTDASASTFGSTGGGTDGSSGNRRILASYNRGRLLCWEQPDVSAASPQSASTILAVERLRDGSGAINGPIGLFQKFAANSSINSQVYDGGWTAKDFHLTYQPSKGDGELPIMLFWPDGSPFPMSAIGFGRTSDIGQGESGDIKVDGTAQTMRGLLALSSIVASLACGFGAGSGGTMTTGQYGSASTVRVLGLYE